MSFVITTRRIESGVFGHKQGNIKYLDVGAAKNVPDASDEIKSTDRWFKKVTAQALADGTDDCGHVVVLVHGFNIDQSEMLKRHRKVEKGLRDQGFNGTFVSFDWPSDGSVAGYLSDRRDARWAASYLMDGAIREFSSRQQPDCRIDVSLIGHSMGCFVVREAFDFADGEHVVSQNNWTVSQVAFVAADISQSSMREGDSESRSLVRHLVRLTNYYNPFDDVLSLSSTKRVGASPRLGRIGLPGQISRKLVNVYCGKYYDENKGNFPISVSKSHSWYFDDNRFYEDLRHTLEGKLDRSVIPKRGVTPDGGFALL